MTGGKIIPLEEACNVEYGTRVVQKRDGGRGYPVYGGGGATFEMETFNREDRLVIARFGMSEQCTRFVKGKFFLNDSGLTVSPRNGLMIQRFLDYQMLALNDDVYRLGKGTAQKNLDVPIFREIPLFVPDSLQEQQRIVALLDEAFAGLATAKANAEQNLQNARALFESHLQSVFSQRGEGWVETTLGEVCEMYQPKTIGLKDLVSDGQYPVFGANGVIGNYDKFNHEEPQLLIACRGATCGTVNISEPYSWITGNAMVVRPLGESLDLEYLEYAFRCGINTSEAITGSAQPQITRTNLSPLPISFPFSVEEQQRLATSFRSLAAETLRLTRLYERKLAALEELKKSLLHQAFNGEL
jgi:type I restriction enzyme S subunit